MPAESQAQRRFLNWKFGHNWVKEHHFDNKGPLPARVQHMAEGGVMSRAQQMYKAKLGSGGRFQALENKFERQGKSNPAGLAAYIGRKKYGAERFQKMAAAGRSG